MAGERAADRLGTGLVVIPEPEACLRKERQAAIAATFAPEERRASEESDEGCRYVSAV